MLPVSGFDGCAATYFQDRPLEPDDTAPCLMVLNVGVRLALGARRREVRSLVVGQSLRMALLGILAGVAVAVHAGWVLESLRLGVDPADPLVLAATAGTLVLVAVAASLAPAVRATRVDPVETPGMADAAHVAAGPPRSRSRLKLPSPPTRRSSQAH